MFSDWPYSVGTTTVLWLTPLLHVVGFAVAVWAYRLSRKVGYLLIAACFLMALCSLFIVPGINRAITTRWPPQSDLSSKAQQQYMDEMLALYKKYHPRVRAKEVKLTFPFAQIMLVSGLWLLARRESRSITKSGTPPNSSPAEASGQSERSRRAAIDEMNRLSSCR